MLFEFIESMRQKPTAVRRRFVSLVTFVLVGCVALIWLGFFLIKVLDGGALSGTETVQNSGIAPPYESGE